MNIDDVLLTRERLGQRIREEARRQGLKVISRSRAATGRQWWIFSVDKCGKPVRLLEQNLTDQQAWNYLKGS